MTAPTDDDWERVVGLLAGAPRVALACHVGPDGDALGSMLALGAGLRARGAEVVASWGGEPFAVPEAYSFLTAVDLLVPPAQFPEAPELLVIAVLALVLFGGSRLPEIARSLGKSIRIFATESRPASSAAHPDEQSATDPHAGTDM